MPDVISLLESHSSVRNFTQETVSPETVCSIFQAASSAASSCFLQVTSVIRITDPVKKEQLAVLAGNQNHVAEAPEFWVFCVDVHRNRTLVPDSDIGWTEQLVMGVQDTAIMAQTAMVALESLGLGGCFIGGIRNHIEAVSNLLGLPEDTFPLLGIAFGHPAYKEEVKPRLPPQVTFMENGYREADPQVLAEYNERMRAYYRSRTHNPKNVSWTDTLKPILQKERRDFVLSYLQRQGFAKK
jgi:nitroreductase